MGHEDAVYLAKLAEQAERYEGIHSPYLLPFQPVFVIAPRARKWCITGEISASAADPGV